MRSVAGGYDNESVAGAPPPPCPPLLLLIFPTRSNTRTLCVSVAAMSGTFWLWLVSLRGGKWIVFCVPCALMYFFMISAWG
jgi:hypothetical protein